MFRRSVAVGRLCSWPSPSTLHCACSSCALQHAYDNFVCYAPPEFRDGRIYLCTRTKNTRASYASTAGRCSYSSSWSRSGEPDEFNFAQRPTRSEGAETRMTTTTTVKKGCDFFLAREVACVKTSQTTGHAGNFALSQAVRRLVLAAERARCCATS